MRFPTFNPNQNLSQYNFTQYFNPSKMKKIIESEWNVEYDEDWLLENGIKDINDAQTHIKKIYRSSKNGRFQPTFMKTEYGRYFYKGSLSIGLLVCPIRHSLCREDYIDFDMINAHYKILEQLCIKQKIPKEHYKYISQYCQQRELIRGNLCKQYFPNEEYSTAKDKIKVLFLRIMYLGSFEKWRKENGLGEEVKQDAHTSKIQDNIVLLLNRIKQDNLIEWNDINKKTEKHNNILKKFCDKNNKRFIPKNPDASFLSLFLQSWERKICECAVEFMIEHKHIKDNTLIYTFDGFMCLKTDMDTIQVCKDLNSRIIERLELDIGWETKDFDRHIDDTVFPKKKEYDFPKDKLVHLDFQYFNDIETYEEKRGYFETFITKTINPQPIYHFKFTNEKGVSSYVMYNKDNIKEAFMEYTLNETKKSNNKGDNVEILFVDKWLKDTEKSLFHKADFRPHPYNPNSVDKDTHILNTFTGYSPDCFNDELDANDEYIKPFLAVVENIVGGNPDDIDIFHNLIAWKVQRPEYKNPYSVLIKSQEGEGKNTVFDTIGRMIGEAHYYQTTNAEDLFGDHAEGVNNKLLIVMNEMNIKQTGKHADKLKSLITDPTFNINPKNIRPLTIRNLAFIVVLSNQENPIYIDETKRDRRWFIFQGNQNNIKINNETWGMIHKRLREPKFIKSLYKYYMKFNLKDFNLTNAKIRNSRRKAYKSVVCRYVKPEILFLQDYIMERRFVGDTKNGEHINPINMEEYVNYTHGSTQYAQKRYWKGYEPTQTSKLNDDMPFMGNEVFWSFGFDTDWYEDGLFLSTKFQFKAGDLRKDYLEWVKINGFNVERNERSQKAFNNAIPTLQLPIEIVGMKAGEKGFVLTPYVVINAMVKRNYLELEQEQMKLMTENYEKTKQKTEEAVVEPEDFNKELLSLF